MTKERARITRELANERVRVEDETLKEEKAAFLKYLMNSDRPVTSEERNERLRFFHEQFHKKRSVLGSIRDLFFFLVMSDRKILIEVMKKYFPELAETLDFDKQRFKPTTRVNLLFERKVADLVFVVPCKDPKDADIMIHVIAEHKAQRCLRDKRRTLLNILEYVALTTKATLNERESDKSQKSNRCPQAIALIVYTGSNERYEAPKWFDLFYLPKGLERRSLSFYIPCVNITRLLMKGEIKGSPLVRGAFSALGYAGKRILAKNLDAIMKNFGKIKIFDWRAKYFIDMSFAYALREANNEGQPITEETYLDAVNYLKNPDMKKELSFLDGWFSEEKEKAMEEKAKERVTEEATEKALKRVATNMLVKKYSYDEVSECTGAPVPQIQTWAQSLNLA